MNCSNIRKQVLSLPLFLLLFLLFMEINLRALAFFYSRKSHLGALQGSAYNIVCLGDSFTYGWGVNTPDTYPKQLETMLTRNTTGKQFRVFNLAVPGSNSSQHLKYLGELMRRAQKPQLVIIMTGANDSWNMAESNIGHIIEKKDALKSALLSIQLFLADLRIYKTVKIVWLNLHGRTFESQFDPFKQIAKREHSDPDILKKLLRYNLEKIVDFVRQNNIAIILQNYPFGEATDENIIQGIAVKNRIPFCDNKTAFQNALKTTDFRKLFLHDNTHPTAAGYTIMAAGLYRLVLHDILQQKGIRDAGF